MSPEEVSKQISDFIRFNSADIRQLSANQPAIADAITNVLTAIDSKYGDGTGFTPPAAVNVVKPGQMYINLSGTSILIQDVDGEFVDARVTFTSGVTEEQQFLIRAVMNDINSGAWSLQEKDQLVKEGQLFGSSMGAKYRIDKILFLNGYRAEADVKVMEAGQSTMAKAGSSVTFEISRIERWIRTGEWKLFENKATDPFNQANVKPNISYQAGNLFETSAGAIFLIEEVGGGTTRIRGTSANGKTDVVSVSNQTVLNYIESGEWRLSAAQWQPKTTPVAGATTTAPTNTTSIVGKVLRKKDGTLIKVVRLKKSNPTNPEYETLILDSNKTSSLKIAKKAIASFLAEKDVAGWRMLTDAAANVAIKNASYIPPAQKAAVVGVKKSSWTPQPKYPRPGPQRSAASAKLGEFGIGYDGLIYIVDKDKNGTQRWVKRKGLNATGNAIIRELSREDLNVLYDQKVYGLTMFSPSDDEYQELEREIQIISKQNT